MVQVYRYNHYLVGLWKFSYTALTFRTVQFNRYQLYVYFYLSTAYITYLNKCCKLLFWQSTHIHTHTTYTHTHTHIYIEREREREGERGGGSEGGSFVVSHVSFDNFNVWASVVLYPSLTTSIHKYTCTSCICECIDTCASLLAIKLHKVVVKFRRTGGEWRTHDQAY